jgi:hypothetical protein
MSDIPNASDARKEWARCRHWIEAALRRSPGFETIEDVERLVAERHYQFWPGRDCAAITEIARFARKKVLIVVHGGGSLEELLDEMEPSLCAFAQAAGCDAIMGTGRKGWERVTEKRGYRFGWTTMVKDLKQ